ncbi:GAF domain-containing protein [Paenibacillus albicereus]|uniref:Circadian input-output histidine kinase CikA n=1 Tax=Paenibacillus albicereus TaxID=2726185 RepID=A0A6H2GU84_9BACL|nr:ATP-binding protein [Paenibacillus albicereus]QJC50993.1 GAF domain-containing protein [Paenibacillus albicereus]
MSRELSTIETFNEAADHILDLLSRLLSLNTLFIAVNDGRTNHILRAFNRTEPLVAAGTQLPLPEAYCSLVPNRRGGAVVIPSTRRHASASAMAVTDALGDRSFVGVPILLADGTLYGTLCAMDDPGYPVSDWELRTLHSMSVFLSYTINLEREHERERIRSEKLQQRRKQAEQRLKRLRERHRSAQARLTQSSDLLAMLSHEIRNSLNGTIGMTDLMQQSGTTEEQDFYLRFMEDSNRNLLQLLDNILDYSKLSDGEVSLEVFPIDLLSIVEDSVFLFASQALAKGLELLIEAEEELPLLYGDAGKIRQVLLNLLSNAIKFTESGSITVHIRSERLEERPGHLRVFLSVADTGSGMTEEELEQLFHKYSRPHEGKRRQEVGAGLGLYISRQLAQRMDGSLTADSMPGRGSVFTFELVLRAEPTPLVQLNHAPVAGKRALLLDGSEDLRKSIGKQLSKWGVFVTGSAEPQDALRLLAEGERFDVLLAEESFSSSPAMKELTARASASGLPLVLMAPIGGAKTAGAAASGLEPRTMLIKPVRRFYLIHALISALEEGAASRMS